MTGHGCNGCWYGSCCCSCCSACASHVAACSAAWAAAAARSSSRMAVAASRAAMARCAAASATAAWVAASASAKLARASRSTPGSCSVAFYAHVHHQMGSISTHKNSKSLVGGASSGHLPRRAQFLSEKWNLHTNMKTGDISGVVQSARVKRWVTDKNQKKRISLCTSTVLGLVLAM